MHSNIDVHSIILNNEFPGDGVKFIEKLQSHCANMTFSEKSRYDIIFQQVTHKGGGSAINSIKIFPKAHFLSVSVETDKSCEFWNISIYLIAYPPPLCVTC